MFYLEVMLVVLESLFCKTKYAFRSASQSMLPESEYRSSATKQIDS
jgi:hypothetical protein